MKYIAIFVGIFLVLGLLTHILDLWFRVFIVGQYYATASLLSNILFGGLPLWIGLGILGIFFAIRSGLKDSK